MYSAVFMVQEACACSKCNIMYVSVLKPVYGYQNASSIFIIIFGCVSYLMSERPPLKKACRRFAIVYSAELTDPNHTLNGVKYYGISFTAGNSPIDVMNKRKHQHINETKKEII